MGQAHDTSCDWQEGEGVEDNLYIDMMFEEQRKKKRVAFLLWLFLGWFGVHRFYAGKTRSGIIQLLLSLSVIGFVLVSFWWWLIDAFLVPDMVNEHNRNTLEWINRLDAPGEPATQAPQALTPADRRREEMLEELRQTGYRKERRDEFGGLYR